MDFEISTRRAKVPVKRPVEIANFLGKPTPSTRAPKFSPKELPKSIRDDIIEHIELINSLDEQVNELVAKATRVFSKNEDIVISKRKPLEEERQNRIIDSDEKDPQIPDYETEI